ncbi:MAG TPA: IclR family transcriptional regulator C-terminal domain-containing protein, partial [Burkholderiales bacterium]|nr:IclR family transcriptional regulator C-terminal domain-containing protein [Burkholderiales bacterium]
WQADNITLTSVGIDIGSSGTQVVFSRLRMRRMSEELSSRYFVVGREAVLELLDEVRSRDYAVDDEESEIGLRAIAAPVRNQNGLVIAALGVAAPVQRMNKKGMQTTVPSVIAIAQAVSSRLGYQPARRKAFHE